MQNNNNEEEKMYAKNLELKETYALEQSLPLQTNN